MNKLKFNSQVCTTVEQSKKLLELGVKPETADCHYLLMDDNWSMGFGFWKQPHQNVPTHYIPAWSLHRLMELNSVSIMVGTIALLKYDNTYDDIIEDIEWAIKKGYFNKGYLNK